MLRDLPTPCRLGVFLSDFEIESEVCDGINASSTLDASVASRPGGVRGFGSMSAALKRARCSQNFFSP